MDPEACHFFYRARIFKQSLNDKRTITQLTLRLSTEPNINIDYSALDVYFVSIDKD
ncbi:MAG: UDP-N-acetylenolpyruvoylglucosamine reductase, partial [Porticoccaceae bacterium]